MVVVGHVTDDYDDDDDDEQAPPPLVSLGASSVSQPPQPYSSRGDHGTVLPSSSPSPASLSASAPLSFHSSQPSPSTNSTLSPNPPPFVPSSVSSKGPAGTYIMNPTGQYAYGQGQGYGHGSSAVPSPGDVHAQYAAGLAFNPSYVQPYVVPQQPQQSSPSPPPPQQPQQQQQQYQAGLVNSQEAMVNLIAQLSAAVRFFFCHHLFFFFSLVEFSL
jgi:hypothetical protein